MKFYDRVTCNTLETDNAFVIEQYTAFPDRYEPVKDGAAQKEPQEDGGTVRKRKQ